MKRSTIPLSMSADVGRGGAPEAEVRRAAVHWTGVCGAAALTASVGGLALQGAHGGTASTAEMLRAYDLVTLVLIMPALGVTTWKAVRGSRLAQLVSTSLVAYLVYTYAYHLLGTQFGDLFLLHAAVVATGAIALVLNLNSVDLAWCADRVLAGKHVRGAAVVLGVLAVALGGMWVYVSLDNALTGRTPAGSQLVETAGIVHLGMALDLTVLVPLYAAAANLLWRRSSRGYQLAAIALIAGLLHQVSYLVAMPFQVAAGIPDAVSFDPGEPLIVLGYLAGIALLAPRNRDGKAAVGLRPDRARRGGPPRREKSS